ncbi:MAG: ferritin-like domain-containing protein [Dehalococcoidales bacterium]|nr:ferritin-like domain-containing protein [Dehalococcoidales bacterium]
MAISDEEIRIIGDTVARRVIDRMGLLPKSYQEPASVEEGLQDSMHEELTAAAWYRNRAANSEEHGDFVTSEMYLKIAREEEEHYLHFSNRRVELLGSKGKIRERIPLSTRIREIIPIESKRR